MNNLIYLDWKWFDDNIKKITNYYQSRDLTHIVGISRGGLIPAVAVSNKLKIPLVSLDWQTRDGYIRDINKLGKIIESTDLSKVLFIDDICDSGTTIGQIKLIAPQSRWCTLITKDLGKTEFSPFVLEQDEERWIKFPWE